jgi:hypothetical protein
MISKHDASCKECSFFEEAQKNTDFRRFFCSVCERYMKCPYCGAQLREWDADYFVCDNENCNLEIIEKDLV